MASTSSSAAVAAMVQRVSQQYLECRRSVTSKVDEVKLLDEQIAAVFQQISALSEAPEGEEELSEEAKAAAKSVGHLEVTLAGVEGEEPVPNATITVALDPEYEADEYETVEEVVEKKDVVVTDEHGHVVEDGQVPEEDGESTPRKLKTTTKITRTVIKKRVKKEKEPVVRTVNWTAAEKSEEGEETDAALTFPATFVFDPVQSREAVVTITVAAASSNEEDEEEEEELIKEIEFPISSLFQGNALDKWYTTTDEEEEEEPTTITELVEEAVKEAIEEEIAAEKAEEAEKTEEGEVTEETEKVEAEMAEETEESVETKKTEEIEKTEETEEAEESDKTEETEEAEEAEKTEEKIEEDEKTDETEKTKEAEEVEQTEEAEEVEQTEETEKIETAEQSEEAEQVEEETEQAEEAEQVQEETKPVVSRFHVKANFVLSEAEKLSISVVALSKKKQEAEAALQVLEREAASLRTKYERLNASQRQLNASSVSKPKVNLLGGRFGAGGVPVQRKSWYQSSRERANAFITKHQQVLVSVAMFTGSVCLFHYNGENLLA
ncbi:hypothetical protein PF002_g345 [Phytophthora fragariae]|uniref:Uncharacterized protein n=1 Tax=Phytophthora fragariae TaxID=53985 RepID=A0A6A3UZ39_9STRA|nr:hypothetical protein PF003_g8337 [Phytophthora fragariae]KAE8950034.1 hypothetical protein PF009_g405 [Phytophthora fragariae]KAE9031289.1 hypothetical protein PF011_g178 [Phytophthora fragariae]KAE9141046.1 hypothetical protein PF007_g365 [Phytophthora fragariae]KAE9155922.1 hypothetical protein PF006_g132 [Phytophthora fragariae]